MENIICNPGYQHIGENIFLTLKYEDLQTCLLINKKCKQILDNPKFWLKKFVTRGLSKKNQKDWMEAIKLVNKNPVLKKNIFYYLKRSSRHERLFDLPCYIDKKVALKSAKLVRKFGSEAFGYLKVLNRAKSKRLLEDAPGNIQLLAPGMKQQNLNEFHGIQYVMGKHYLRKSSFLHHAADDPHAEDGNIDVVKAIAPLFDNPNLPDNNGWTTMHRAASRGRLEVVKFLTTLVEDSNFPDKEGHSPLAWAAMEGKLEPIKFLATLTPDAVNAQGIEEMTPLHHASIEGHLEVIKFLVPLTKNLLVPDNEGKTALDYAIENRYANPNRYDECIRLLNSSIIRASEENK